MWIAYQAVADLQRHMPVAQMVAGPCQQQRVAAACLGHRFCSRPDAHDQTVLAAQEITVPQNLAELSDALLDPLGISLVSEQDADAQGVNQAVFGAMQARFDGQAGAFAYLLFVLLYFPCVATIGAIVFQQAPPSAEAAIKALDVDWVIEARDGREALQLARNEHPDLIILDLMLPDLDGFEVLRRLRQDGVFPDCFTIQSWYKLPQEHLPEDGGHSFMHTARDSIRLIRQLFPQADPMR